MHVRRTRTDVIPGIVEKALGNSRAGTKKKGGELCAMYMEVENGGEGLIVSTSFAEMTGILLMMRFDGRADGYPGRT